MVRIVVAGVVAIVLLATPAGAQWLNYKTPGIPRTADGKPDLSAPVPRMADGKPDLSGLWGNDSVGAAEMNKAMESVKPLAWAAALSDARKENLFRDDPRVMCLPAGPLVNFWPGKIGADTEPSADARFRNALSRGFSGRPRTPERSQSGLARLFRRTLGRRDPGDRKQRLQRSDLDRFRRPSAH